MATPPKKPASKTPRKPLRPKNLPHGRWLGDFPDLSAAELRLVECCRIGHTWIPDGGDWQNPVRPTKESDANRIRADLIRFLALGGDALNPVHEAGVNIQEAWITGTLSLHQCRAPLRIDIRHCYFNFVPDLTAASFPELVLNGSAVPGLDADRISVIGIVGLRDGFTSTGEVRLLGAQIGGNLECSGSRFSSVGGYAISADRIKVMGNVFLRDGFTASGAVRFPGAEIGGNFECDSGEFINIGLDALIADGIRIVGDMFLRNGCSVYGVLRLPGAEIGGNLDCNKGNFSNVAGRALFAEGVSIRGAVFLREAIIHGAVLLSAAKIGTLVDDLTCWQSKSHELDGLYYDRIIGPLDAASRIAWLKSQRTEHVEVNDWRPQPWEQLVKVMRDMGHAGVAAEIAMEKQRMMRAAGQIGTRISRTDFPKPWQNRLDARWANLSNAIARGFHSFYGAIAGYGHRPTRIAAWMLAVWLACSLFFELGREYGHFGPSSPVINSSAALNGCGARGETTADGSPKAYWHSLSCPMPVEYTTLWPPLYSLDLILPLIDLQQDSDWAPIVVNENGEQQFWGYALRALMWFEILFGWLASLMFVAIVSRLVDKD